MKKTIITLSACLALVMGGCTTAGSLFNPTAQSGSAEASTGGGLIGALGGIFSDMTASDNFDVARLKGSWSYARPAVTFKSANLLQNIGGAAAAQAIENKLEPYYKSIGLTKQQLTVADDMTFTMTMGFMQASGNITKASDGTLNFNFNVLGKSLGTVNAHASLSGNKLNLTFDGEKLVEMMGKVSQILGNSTIKSLQSLLASYDGIYIGSELNRTK